MSVRLVKKSDIRQLAEPRLDWLHSMDETLGRNQTGGLPIALAAASATICPSAIAASFDGNWSVVAQTTQGHCGSMRFGLAINHGRLYSAGGYYVFGYPAQLGGRVSPSGYVQANGVAGPRTAYAVGRLRQFQGSGTWAGSGPSGVCSGVWNAAPLRQTF
jgi:hypothetical protein